MQEIDTVLQELSSLSTSIPLEKVANQEQANLRLFLGEKEAYVALVEPRAAGIAEGNSGFATIAWNDEFEIIRASACIDVVNFTDRNFLRHVIREELAQTLGLINDTELDDESIFYQFVNNSIAYSPRDEALIAYMLGNELAPGMCESEVMEVLE